MVSRDLVPLWNEVFFAFFTDTYREFTTLRLIQIYYLLSVLKKLVDLHFEASIFFKQ